MVFIIDEAVDNNPQSVCPSASTNVCIRTQTPQDMSSGMFPKGSELGAQPCASTSLSLVNRALVPQLGALGAGSSTNQQCNANQDVQTPDSSSFVNRRG